MNKKNMLLKFKKKMLGKTNRSNLKKKRRRDIDKIKLNIIGIKEMLLYKLLYLKGQKK